MFEQGGKPENHKKGNGTKKLLIAASIVIVVLAGVAGYFMWRTISLSSSSDASTASKKSTDIIEKVGKIYELPSEKPTVAQIKDTEKLKEQAFFAKARAGDYLLVYTNEKMALIYREETNKIINAGPISPEQASPEKD